MSSPQLRQSLLRDIENAASQYDIPQQELTVDVYQDTQRQADIAQVSFRAPGSMDKYGGELALTRPANVNAQAQQDIIDRQIHDLLRQLEAAWLEEGGRVTFYKGHGFFYRYTSDMGKACLEVQCTVCNHVEMINKRSTLLDEYRDVFLMATLPKADRNCDCHHSRYDPVSIAVTERFI